MTVKFIYTMQV